MAQRHGRPVDPRADRRADHRSGDAAARPDGEPADRADGSIPVVTVESPGPLWALPYRIVELLRSGRATRR